MENKRGLIFSLLILLFSTGFASATLENDLNRFSDSFFLFVRFILGDVSNSELMLIKTLVFLLLLAVINSVLKKVHLFEDRISTIVAIIVSLISIRFITTEQLINFIWLPYGGLGVLIASIFPFIIFFFFIEDFDSNAIRKVGWVSFIFIYFLLAQLRWDDLRVGPEWWHNYAAIYAGIAIVSILIFIFDKSIRKAVVMSAIEEGYTTNNLILKAELQKKLEKLQEALALGPSRYDEAKIKKKIEGIRRQMRSMS